MYNPRLREATAAYLNREIHPRVPLTRDNVSSFCGSEARLHMSYLSNSKIDAIDLYDITNIITGLYTYLNT